MLKSLSALFGAKAIGAPRPGQSTPRTGLSAEDLALIVPMIKGTASSAGSNESGTDVRLSFEQSPASRPFAADMVVLYAVDRPNHLEYVSNELALASGLSAEQLHRRSIENLPSRLGQVQLHDCGDGVYGLSAGGTFEASLLLLPDLWHQLQPYLPGDPMAAVPSRDLLFVIGSNRPSASGLITAKARINLAEKRYAISQAVIVKQGTEWVALAH